MAEEVGSGVELIWSLMLVAEIVAVELRGTTEELDISTVLELVAAGWELELSEEIALDSAEDETLELDGATVEEISDELIGTDETALEGSTEDEITTTELDAASVEEKELLEMTEGESLELARAEADEEDCAVLEYISDDETLEELATSTCVLVEEMTTELNDS